MRKKQDNIEQLLKTAAAVKYDAEKNTAPAVVASGRGEIAERIIRLALESDIPVNSDPQLAALLSKLKVGTEIPVELYRAVAEILAFVYSLNENQRS